MLVQVRLLRCSTLPGSAPTLVIHDETGHTSGRPRFPVWSHVLAFSAGGVAVTRRETGTRMSSDGTMESSWYITFPLSARDAPELGVDGVALEGSGAAGNIVETQSARAPEIQRISSSASSQVSGGFSVAFGDERTAQIRHNASALQVKG